jgi:predicted Rossmann-fold nucleotide-binding protein
MVEKDPFLNFISDLSEKIKISKEHKQIMERVNDPRASIDESKAYWYELMLVLFIDGVIQLKIHDKPIWQLTAIGAALLKRRQTS